MDPKAMLQVATTLFAITALGGLAMAAIRFGSKRNPPSWLAMVHGFLAAAGLTLLSYAVFVLGAGRNAQWALGLLVVAAIGGVAMNLGYQLKERPLPSGLLIVHGLIAVAAFALLIASAFA